MAITPAVQKLIKEFESENPAGKGKTRIGSGTRTVDEQLEILLQPKRANNYVNIKKRFLKAFELKALPAYDALTDEQTRWWRTEIGKQAGKPNGFAHVGGNAQDVVVGALDLELKTKLRDKLQTKFGVLNERVNGDKSDYGVSLNIANVFHVYVGGPTKAEPKSADADAKARAEGKIAGSVGRKGANDSGDVEIVQKLLSKIALPPLAPVRVTGKIDEQTILAIEHFQTVILKMARPDGTVDPRGKTFEALRRTR